jgi:4-amino-4-deoxy-L-arabinose transferase-like glycosyltransferase
VRAPVVGVAAGLGALLLATAGRYDYHRDELYFRELGRHPAWGYVDQPPLTPLLGRVSTALFGDTVWAFRLPAVAAVLATAFVVALIARELGGGTVARTLAGLGLVSTFPLIGGHVLATASFDLVVWTVVILFVLRALRRDQPGWWLAAGLVVGIGLYNKHLVVLLLLGLAGGLLIGGPRRTLASPWLWAGVAVALVVGAPNLVYQATHDWPQFAMAEALRRDKGDEARLTFVPLQLVMLGPPLVAIWVAGIVTLWRDRALRAVALAYPLLCVLLLLLAGQPYYTMGLLVALYAAGCVPVERWIRGRPGRRVLLAAAFAVNVAVSVPIALPVLPVRVLARTPIPAVNQVQRDQIGWPAYVAQVAAVYAALPAADRAAATIVTGNYGEAGALNRYGGRYRLPPAYSGQNELYRQGPPPASATIVLLVGIDQPDRQFASCVVSARLDNGVGIDNEEQGRPVVVCRDLRESWSTLWPRFRHVD